jgi:hypothetical protein
MSTVKRPAFYEGDYNGQHWQSVHPRLYRVVYRARIGTRVYDYDSITSAMSEGGARDRVQRRSGMTLLGSISVEHVHDLDPVYR